MRRVASLSELWLVLHRSVAKFGYTVWGAGRGGDFGENASDCRSYLLRNNDNFGPLDTVFNILWRKSRKLIQGKQVAAAAFRNDVQAYNQSRVEKLWYCSEHLEG